MTSTNEAWLAQVHEEALEPDLPIVDPHHHLWEFRHERVAHRYLMDDIQADLRAGHNIVATVFIEAGAMYRADGPAHLRCVGETEFANGIAAMSASGLYGPARVCDGIIAHADLRRGDGVDEVLDAHARAAGPRFKGIRHSVTWDASPEVPDARTDPVPGQYLAEEFQQGARRLAARGLSLEGWCYHTQIPELTSLARAVPDLTIVLDHFGGPVGVGPYAGRRDEIHARWRGELRELAACPNVVAKLGGINMELNGFGWHERDRPPGSDELLEATRPWYEFTIETFGAERCMFESNFPVDMCSCSYVVLWNSFKKLCAGASADEKRALFHDTAARVYRLDP